MEEQIVKSLAKFEISRRLLEDSSDENSSDSDTSAESD